MRILLIKTSSLGDLIHTFPALSELAKLNSNFRVDWVVERSFAEIPAWHPLVCDVIPVDMRKWRRQLLSRKTWQEWPAFVDRLHRYQYDVIIDAQGLLKSALIARKGLGKKHGLDWRSAWEPLASLFYDETHSVDPKLHAIHRMQSLFGEVFDYEPDFETLNFGLMSPGVLSSPSLSIPIPSSLRTRGPSSKNQPYLLFVHATTWQSKHWPLSYWKQLAAMASEKNFKILLPWGNDQERQQAEEIASGVALAEVLPKMNLTDLSALLAGASGAVAVDTGLAHVSAALDVPLVSLYGPTNPDQTGTLGCNATVLKADFGCAPCAKPTCQFKGESSVIPACFAAITPERVWDALEFQLKSKANENFGDRNDLQPA